jgi:hypothetical protein
MANDAGGEDNITVLVVDVNGEDASTGTAVGSVAAQEPPPPPERVPTNRDVLARPRRRWLRPLVMTLVVIALAAGGGYAAARYALGNSWFVGIDDTGRVTIFSGIPEDVAGLELSEPVTTTATSIDDLPGFMRPRVRRGIKVESRAEAEATVRNLNDRVRDFAPQQGG